MDSLDPPGQQTTGNQYSRLRLATKIVHYDIRVESSQGSPQYSGDEGGKLADVSAWAFPGTNITGWTRYRHMESGRGGDPDPHAGECPGILRLVAGTY